VLTNPRVTVEISFVHDFEDASGSVSLTVSKSTGAGLVEECTWHLSNLSR